MQWVRSDAKIDIQPGTQIEARDFTAYASSYGKMQSSTLASILIGGAAGVMLTDARVDVAGTVTTTGNATIRATTDHHLDVFMDVTGAMGLSLGAAVKNCMRANVFGLSAPSGLSSWTRIGMLCRSGSTTAETVWTSDSNTRPGADATVMRVFVPGFTPMESDSNTSATTQTVDRSAIIIRLPAAPASIS